MKQKFTSTIYSNILFVIGLIDILRGFLHTYVVTYSAKTFAQLDLTILKQDQLTLLGAFGISNILTGLMYILISKKSKELSPYILGIIPISYLIGFIGLKISGVISEASFYGKYFMLVYLAVCTISFLHFALKNKKV